LPSPPPQGKQSQLKVAYSFSVLLELYLLPFLGDIMTTKIKIIAGFLTMILLLAFVSTIGYRGLSNVSVLFEDFVQAASQNVATSETVSHINAAAFYLEKFMRLSDSKDMGRSIASQEKSLESMREGIRHATDPERKQRMQKAESLLRNYVETLKVMQRDLAPWYSDYTQIIGPAFETSKKIVGYVPATAWSNLRQPFRIFPAWPRNCAR
jgi:hypothetical protein